MSNRRFTRELLDEILQRDGATLVGEYEKLTIETLIFYSCKCKNKHNKCFRNIVENGGALCKICCKIQQLEKTKKTWIERYGVENPNQNKEIREKSKKTSIEKYGVEYPSQSEKIKEKTKIANIEKYGVTSTSLIPEIKQKQKDTLMLRYGVDHNFATGELRDKRKETFIRKYGVEHQAQSQEVQEKQQKNAKKYKEFVMPSGEIRKVQGYEPFALKHLLEEFEETQIITDRKNVPNIQYQLEDKQKRHFPDIFIPHLNKIIEVKSTWTYKCKSDNIQLKKKAAEQQGFLYEIWCYDKKGIRVEV